jgi:hypothetical protein
MKRFSTPISTIPSGDLSSPAISKSAFQDSDRNLLSKLFENRSKLSSKSALNVVL